MYSFKEFAEEMNLEITDRKGKLFDYLDGKKIILLKTYINIKKISCDELSSGKYVLLDVCYICDSEDNWIEAKCSRDMKVTCNWKEVYKEIDKYINQEYRKYVLDIIKNYFTRCIEKYVKEHPEFFTKCGWIKMYNGYGFLGINLDDAKLDSDLAKDFFDGLMSSGHYKEGFVQQCKVYSNFEQLFKLILEDKCAFVTFVYSIHSIMWHGIYGYKSHMILEHGNKEDSIFSLCIYGKDIKRAKILANILANVFCISQKNWTVIHRKYHISASSITDSDLNKIKPYRSVPILVTSKRNKIIKSNSIVKKIQRLRSKEQLFIFPVFISESPIMIDEMVNCSCENLHKFFKVSEVDLFFNIHKEFCFVILELVKYFSKIADGENFLNRDPYRRFVNYPSILEGIKKSEEWIHTHIPEVLLYATAEGFLSFLEETPLQSWVEKLRKKAKEIFITADDTENSNDISSNITFEINETLYLKELVLFLLKEIKLKKNQEWIFEGKESRGEQEECYYLCAKIGFKKFQLYLNKKHINVIKERQFVKILKENDVLKLPNSGVSNTFKRKDMYVYILKKNSLNKYCDSVF